jgi:hypothetical protein
MSNMDSEDNMELNVIVNFIKNEFSVDERVMKQLAYHHSLA